MYGVKTTQPVDEAEKHASDQEERAIIILAEVVKHLGGAMRALYRHRLDDAELHIGLMLYDLKEALECVRQAQANERE